MKKSKDNQEYSEYIAIHPGFCEFYKIKHSDQTLKLSLVMLKTEFAEPTFLALQNAPEIGDLMGDNFSNLTLEGEVKRIQDILSSTDEYSWCIKDHDHIIGNVSINFIGEKSEYFGCRAASMAIIIWDKKYWNKKVARTVNTTILDWAFTEGHFEIMVCRIKSFNLASIKSYTGLGFKEDGSETTVENIQITNWNNYKLSKQQWLERHK